MLFDGQNKPKPTSPSKPPFSPGGVANGAGGSPTASLPSGPNKAGQPVVYAPHLLLLADSKKMYLNQVVGDSRSGPRKTVVHKIEDDDDDDDWSMEEVSRSIGHSMAQTYYETYLA